LERAASRLNVGPAGPTGSPQTGTRLPDMIACAISAWNALLRNRRPNAVGAGQR
jgi:hypothetical protein